MSGGDGFIELAGGWVSAQAITAVTIQRGGDLALNAEYQVLVWVGHIWIEDRTYDTADEARERVREIMSTIAQIRWPS